MNDIARSNSVLKAIEGVEAEKLKDTLLNMLIQIDEACKRYNVEFCIAYGSALGAYRHNDFIPWDDDVDICMTREEWNVFVKFFEQELGEYYVLEAPNYGDKDPKVVWGKIYLKDSLLEEVQDVSAPYNKGIFIDVFIVDGVSNNKIIRKLDNFIINWMKAIATSQVYYMYPNKLMEQFMGGTISTKLYYKARKFIGFAFSWVSHKKWCSLFDKYVSRHKNSDYVTVSTGWYLDEIVKRNDWKPYDRAIFRGVEFNVPKNISNYLEKNYGKNYMQIPPPNKRERHFVVNLKFPNA